MTPTHSITPENFTAREYGRVSHDDSGDERSVGEQHDENQQEMDRIGVLLVEPAYLDNDRSASRYATRPREGYDELIADLAADRYEEDWLTTWTVARGSRDMKTWQPLVSLLALRGKKIYITSAKALYDPNDPNDWHTLMREGLDAEKKALDTSVDTRRTMTSNAAAGKPHGQIPYGYLRRYELVQDGKSKKVITHQEEDPIYGPLMRELFARVKAGHSFRGIEKDWVKRGIVTKSGRPFSAAHLRSIVRARLYCGEREHTPGRRGSRCAPGEEPASVVDGQWDGLVSKADWLAVQRILNAPERRTSRPGRGIHFVSMIAKCGVELDAETEPGIKAVCVAVMIVSLRTKEPQYVCRNGHIRIGKAELDDYAEEVVLEYLADPDAYGPVEAHARNDDKALAKAHGEVAKAQEDWDKLIAAYNADRVELEAFIKTEPVKRAKLKAAQAREAELSTPSKLRGLITPGEDVASQWEVMPMSAKREVARMLFAPDWLGELRVLRAPTRRSPVEDRVQWWKPE